MVGWFCLCIHLVPIQSLVSDDRKGKLLLLFTKTLLFISAVVLWDAGNTVRSKPSSGTKVYTVHFERFVFVLMQYSCVFSFTKWCSISCYLHLWRHDTPIKNTGAQRVDILLENKETSGVGEW